MYDKGMSFIDFMLLGFIIFTIIFIIMSWNTKGSDFFKIDESTKLGYLDPGNTPEYIRNKIEKCNNNKYCQNIYSINLEKDIKGDFLIGTGSVKSVKYYYYYTYINGGLTLEKIPANKTVIYMTENDSPYLLRNPFGYKEFSLYIPKNTIIKEYNLN